MIDERPQADRILIARLTGTARRHARLSELTADGEAAAVAELRELAAGRADLLAEVAGIKAGATEGKHDESWGQQASRLCRLAGADEAAIAAWAEERRRRRSAANMPPFSGGLRGGVVRP